MRLIRPLVTVALALQVPITGQAQSREGAVRQPAAGESRKPQTIVFAGLIQPVLLRGANVAVTHLGSRFSVSYSHGVHLRYGAFSFLRSASERMHGLTVDSPWSTGAGFGARLGAAHDLRLEIKAHRYHVTSPAGEHIRYTTWSIGPGLYRRRQAHGSRLVVEPSIRFWPNAGSSLPDGEHIFTAADGTRFRHRPHQLGLIANVSLGWAF